MVDRHVAPVLRRNVLVSEHLFLTYSHVCLLTLVSRYVAVHAMQDDGHSHHDEGMNGFADHSQRNTSGPQVRDTLATVGGMLLPLLTQIGHH